MSEEKTYELLFLMWLTLSAATILLPILKSYKLKNNILENFKNTYEKSRVGQLFFKQIENEKLEDVGTRKSIEGAEFVDFELESKYTKAEEKKKVFEWEEKEDGWRVRKDNEQLVV